MPLWAEPSAAPTLTPALAQQIAGETSAIIGLNVIITDAAGFVIGSGDQSRVGTFHEASIEVIETHRVTWHNAAEARSLEGVRPGMTLPIVHEGVGVGTVGITGSPARVRRLGQVVKRQTEILISEAVLLRSRMTRERVLENLVRDLLDYDEDNASAIAARAAESGYALDVPRQAVVVEVGGGSDRDAAVASPLRLIRELFAHAQDISCSLTATRHVVLRHADAGHRAEWRSELTDLSHRIAAQVGRPCPVGVGGVVLDPRDIATSYAEARTALRTGPQARRTSPFYIDDLRVEQLLSAVPMRIRTHVSDEITRSLRTMGDWPTTRATVIAWVESGFVLVAAAEGLNVHRNTLVYRLRRISSVTGWPTTDRRHWLALYLACLSDSLEDA